MGGNRSLRIIVLVAAAVAAGSLVLAVGFGSALRWRMPDLLWESGRREGRVTDVEETRAVPAQGLERISVEAVSERVEVRRGAGDAVTVRLQGRVAPPPGEPLPRISVQPSDGALSVAVERGRIAGLWSDLTLSVELPAGYEGVLSVRGVSGAVELTGGAFRQVDVSCTSGAVHAVALKARSLSIGTSSGAVRLDGAEAERALLSTTSGSIAAEGLSGAVRAESVSGRIQLDFASAPSSLEAQSTSGSVRIGLPEDARFALDASSTSGAVSCAFPITLSKGASGEHALVGTVNGGTGPVKVRTVSGAIRIQR